jgi:hypothetical protein
MNGDEVIENGDILIVKQQDKSNRVKCGTLLFLHLLLLCML